MTVLKITLVRHGRPTVSLSEWVSGQSLCAFIDRYNQAGISESSHPPQDSFLAIQGGRLVFTSDYRRTIESAKLLKIEDASSHPTFREVDCWINFPSPFATPAWVWLLITRVFWPLGWIQSAESLQQAQARASEGAALLMAKAQVHHHVVLVGHGGMNTLISRELRSQGWQGLKQPQLSHWAATTYCCSQERSP